MQLPQFLVSEYGVETARNFETIERFEYYYKKNAMKDKRREINDFIWNEYDKLMNQADIVGLEEIGEIILRQGNAEIYYKNNGFYEIFR